jgi:hypothetical protein
VKSQVKAKQRARIYERDGWHCQYCGLRITCREEGTCDHVIPVSLGGSNEDSNLRLACRSCNSTKGDRSEQWLRLFLAHGQTKFGQVITLDQYHKLRGLGVDLPPLPTVTFFHEAAA